MTERADRPLVGLRPITDKLITAWDDSAAGPRAVFLQGGAGSGRNTAVNALLDAIKDKGEHPAIVRFHTLPTDDGIQSLLKTYGSLVTSITRKEPFAEDPVALLDGAIESVSDDRVAQWLSGIVSNVREFRNHTGGNFQIRLPPENPYLGALYAMDVLGPHARWLIDLRGSVILDEHHGLCPRVIPPGRHRGYPSLPYWLAAQRQRSELLGEELRLLYVAATRARDLLILTGSASRKAVEEKWNFDPNERISTPNLLGANRYLDWIAPACARLTGDAEWNLKPKGTGPTLAWTFVASDDLSLASDALPASVVIPTERIETDLDSLIERITWNYAHEDAAHEAAKASVTAIRRRLNETTAEEALPLFRQTQDSPASPQPAREALTGTSRLAAAAIGNAHHAFLQNVALDRTGDEESLRSEAERLVSLQSLSRDEADALDLDALLRFWTSEMGAGIRARSEFVRRELPFTARFSLDEIESLLSGDNPAKPDEEFVVVQGAVDLVLVTEQAIEILDFKTDRMRESDLDQKQTLYGPQLKMYAAALKKIYRKPVTRAALHFLSINRTVEIDL